MSGAFEEGSVDRVLIGKVCDNRTERFPEWSLYGSHKEIFYGLVRGRKIFWIPGTSNIAK